MARGSSGLRNMMMGQFISGNHCTERWNIPIIRANPSAHTTQTARGAL